MRPKWKPWRRPIDDERGKINRDRWQKSRSPGQLVYHLFGDTGPTAWRDRRRCLLFELACCRRGRSLIETDPVRATVAVLEAAVEHGDSGRVEEVPRPLGESAGRPPEANYLLHEEQLPGESRRRPSLTSLDHMRCFVLSIKNHEMADFDAHYLRAALALGGEAFAEELAAQADIVRDIFGDPFRPVVFRPEWRTDTAVAIARGMYEAHEFGVMPILADALQDAGCNDEDVLGHCRDPNRTHVRGCWVVDRVLGKQ